MLLDSPWLERILVRRICSAVGVGFLGLRPFLGEQVQARPARFYV